MLIIIDVKGESQSPKITIDTKELSYPYAFRQAIELALSLDGNSEEMINEIFGIMPDMIQGESNLST